MAGGPRTIGTWPFLDPVVMLKMVESMRTHSAADLLPKVDAPTLIVAADLDTFTPVALAKVMQGTRPDAELIVIEGAGHGAVIEKPDQVNAAVRSFLDRRVAARAGGVGVERACSQQRTGPS